MDQINASQLSYAQLYFQIKGHQAQPAAHPAAQAETPAVKAASPASGDFSSMFGDDELAKLQSNLEAISKFAETALKKIES